MLFYTLVILIKQPDSTKNIVPPVYDALIDPDITIGVANVALMLIDEFFST